MITRTELERTRRATVVCRTLGWIGSNPEDMQVSGEIVDALDLLDNEDEAAFQQGQPANWGDSFKGTPLEVPLTDRELLEQAGYPVPDPTLDDIGLTPPGRRIRDPHEPTRKLPAYVHTLDEANAAELDPLLTGLVTKAELSDWTFFKGCLLGLAVALALYGGISWGLMYYG